MGEWTAEMGDDGTGSDADVHAGAERMDAGRRVVEAMDGVVESKISDSAGSFGGGGGGRETGEQSNIALLPSMVRRYTQVVRGCVVHESRV